MTPNIFKGKVHKMDKIAVVAKQKKEVKIEFNEQEIIVKPYISIESKIVLMNNYISMLFEPGKDLVSNYIGAEYALILGVVDFNTNVLVSEESINIDNLVGSGLWNMIVDKIYNYYEFKNEVEVICERIKEKVAIERSFNTSFDKLSNAIIGFIEKVSDLDLSEAGIKNLVEAMKTEVGEYKNIVSPEPAKKPRKKAVAKE
jgi:hypothetical protein